MKKNQLLLSEEANALSRQEMLSVRGGANDTTECPCTYTKTGPRTVEIHVEGWLHYALPRPADKQKKKVQCSVL